MISVDQLALNVGEFSLSNISFQIPTGTYAVLMGKTGCGKTTLIEAICGLRKLSSGNIYIDGVDVSTLRPAERNIGFMPQDIALFKHLNVYEQIAFALRIKKWRKEAIDERVQELAENLQILHLLKRKPRGLSGGERQRVALGRALALRPSILCLDEPLSALDEETYAEVLSLLKDVKGSEEITTLHITHRASEALILADQSFCLKDGALVSHFPNGE